MEERSLEVVETQPEILAYHYTEAGFIEQAVKRWQQAGEKASKRSANVEAITHLTKGLELHAALPETPAHLQSWTLQVALGSVLLNTKGYAYDLLAPVYDWFTEGFDTADLIDAKSLMDELSTNKGVSRWPE